MRRGADGLFQCVGTHQGRRAVILVLVEHLFGYVDPGMLLVELLHAAFAGEDMGQVVDRQRLMCLRVDGRQCLVGHVGLYVVPLCGNLAFLKNEFLLFAHDIVCFVVICLQKYNFIRN